MMMMMMMMMTMMMMMMMMLSKHDDVDDDDNNDDSQYSTYTRASMPCQFPLLTLDDANLWRKDRPPSSKRGVPMGGKCGVGGYMDYKICYWI